MRIVFFGTPEIAATCLASLLDTQNNVVAVVSQPDKPAGRGYALTPPPVKVLAERHGIPVVQPEKLRDPAFETWLKAQAPDLIVVVAYGKILPKFVLDTPRLGCINVHVSLLPRWRGAAPMQRAIMAGDRETGVTIMYMDEGLDTGDILLREAFPIEPTDTFETVHDKSAALGARLLPRALSLLEAGAAPRIPQDTAGVTYAAKIEKSECEIDFSLPAEKLDPILRGLTPIPLPFTYLPGGRLLKVLSATPTEGHGAPGEILALSDVGDGSITVACGEGALAIRRLRPEGKGTMTAAAFLRGARLTVGERLGR